MATTPQHQALYRQYRPARFGDVRGQEHVSRALLNAVNEDRVGHAYLFSGPRGTGKTSTARILAMALNCTERGDDGEPCGACESCRSIRAGTSVDVHELDAASNRGVDDIRDLISKVALGTPGNWKVYIIDEVHRLTPDASSALLKTLEEPPSHVVFVLATTDPQKVLATIRSRCQHYELHLISGDTLEALVKDISRAEGLELSDSQLAVVVRRGQGSARDTLSALDQAAAAGGLEDDGGAVDEILATLGTKDAKGVLVCVAKAINQGRDPRQLATDILERLRDYFLVLQAPELVALPEASVAELKRQGAALGLARSVKAIESVGAAATEMRDCANPRVTLEVALIRLVAPKLERDIDVVLQRMDDIERRLGQGALCGSGPGPGDVAPEAPASTVVLPPSLEATDEAAVAPLAVAREPGPLATTQPARPAPPEPVAEPTPEHDGTVATTPPASPGPETSAAVPAPERPGPPPRPSAPARNVPPRPSAPTPPVPGQPRSFIDAFPGAVRIQ